MEASYSTVWKGKRPPIHRLQRRWCLVAIKKGVRYYLKRHFDPPYRFYKAPGIREMQGFRTLDDAERWADKPGNRLYHVEDASRNIALCWFEKLRFTPYNDSPVNNGQAVF